MTPTSAASLVRHLATVVMGWEFCTDDECRGNCGLAHEDGRRIIAKGVEVDDPYVVRWNPLTDANAMLECVCEAGMREVTGELDWFRDGAMAHAEGKVGSESVCPLNTAAICEAVCLVIARATGWISPEEARNANA